MIEFNEKLKILLNEDVSDTLVNSFGYSRDIANDISDLSEKYAIWLGKNIKKWIEDNTDYSEKMPKQNVGKLASIYKNAGYEDINKQTVRNEMFSLYFVDFKRRYWNMLEEIISRLFEVENKPNLNIKELDINTANEYLHKLNFIRDWSDNVEETPNLKRMSWDVAYETARKWHDSLRSQDTEMDDNIEDDIVMQFSDGFFWRDLKTDNCSQEAKAMGHCGSSSGDVLYSLRDGKNRPHITAAFKLVGDKRVLRQMKGKGNERPNPKYHKYIAELLGNKKFNVRGIDYRFEQGGQYGKDFHPDELSPELQNYLYGANKFMRKFLDAPQRLVTKYNQKFNELTDEGWSIEVFPNRNSYNISFKYGDGEIYNDLSDYMDIKPRNIPTEKFILVIKVLNELKRNKDDIREEINFVRMLNEIKKMKKI
jgi:hypothetical protein